MDGMATNHYGESVKWNSSMLLTILSRCFLPMSVNLLLLHIRAEKLPDPILEYKFHPVRRWRFDMCWPEYHLAVEVDGGVWANMRHTRGSGFIKDQEKTNNAALLGWYVLRFHSGTIKSGEAIKMVKQFIFDSEK